MLKAGFAISVVAAEPLLESPVAMTFDRKGRIWVAELTGYMRNIEGSDEEIPDGRIVVLEDRNGDGRMDQRTVFLDSLVLPRALAIVNDGLLYAEPPELWWVPIENDGPGERILVDSFYAPAGNVEHQANGLLYNLDNWIYNAKSNTRYRYKDGKWLKEATSQRGQWGISNDDLGRLYYNDNSNPLFGDYLPPNQLTDNPHLKSRFGTNRPLISDRRVFPYQATSVNRGYLEEVLDEENKLIDFTSACGPLVYRGDQLPSDCYGNAFVCGPEANLVKRYILADTQGRVAAKMAYPGSEFLVSKDETFRPVNLNNGPDGALYVVDMRRGIIQHRAFMTSYLHEQILEKGLDTVINKGRIYRITGTERKNEALPDLTAGTPDQSVARLQDENGWIRQTAQQYLVEQQDHALVPAIEKIASDRTSPFGQIHALWTLEGLEALRPDHLAGALSSNDPLVVATGVRLSELFFDQADDALRSSVFQLTAKPQHPVVDLQLCHTLGKWPDPQASSSWLALAKRHKNDPLFAEALLSGVAGKEELLLQSLLGAGEKDTITSMLQEVIANKAKNLVFSPRISTANDMDKRTAGFYLYQTYCGGCHGQDGQGIENLAPPLFHSEYVSGNPEKLVLIALHGLQGPVTIQGVEYELNQVMPGLKDNPALDDEKIAAILTYIRNGFSNGDQGGIESAEIGRIRAMTALRNQLFTAGELDRWVEENKGTKPAPIK